MFLGEYQHSLDAKGRIILPSRFRGRLESGLVLSKGLDGCLWVMSLDDWERFSLRLNEISVADSRGRDTARFFFAGASEDRPDKQGRISIPEPLRRHAGLEGDVIVLGTGPRIEVWNPERWERKRSSVEDNLEDRIEGLQI
ncbi:MAG TPA: division/cell wall cluster transcriptional repressor MraZ [Actinomycetota bacterium]|nr:division/cell wall cluster transcriptional repressor MraZ [Actinomycetota bacterium]